MKPQEGKLTHTEASPTAATASNPLYGPSGVQTYRVLLQTAFGTGTNVDVDAATGDEAAILALTEHQGAKVVHVSPAPKKD